MTDTSEINETLNVLLQQKKLLEQKLQDNPKDYTAMYALALRHYHLRELRSCSELCHKLADLGAEQIEVYNTGSKADLGLGNNEKSEKIVRQGLEFFPEDADLYLHLATALHRQEKYEEAEDAYKKSIKISPDSEDTYIALGKHYTSTGQMSEAIDLLKEGLDRFPEALGLWNNLGAAYTRLDMHLPASECYIKAVKIDPQNADALVNTGISMEKLNNLQVAAKFYDEALKVNPNHGLALCMKAITMCMGGLSQESMPIFEEGINVLQNTVGGMDQFISHYSNYVFYQHYVPYRSRQVIYDAIKKFYEISCSDIIEKPAIDFQNIPDKNRPLKIGLLSKGFNVHPVGQMIYSALTNIDRKNFELICFTELGVNQRDELTDKIYDTVDEVVRVGNMMNQAVAELIREKEVDVLIEMTGHSEGGRRLPMIAQRAAPVQVKWVGGLFNTTCVPQMDWLITDHVETPEGVDEWYTEKLYRMPDDYIVYYPAPYAPDVEELPAKKNGFVTFGNLNNLAKTNSFSIELWAKIMNQVPNSKLLLKGHKMHEQHVQKHIRESFSKNGIEGDRIIVEGGEKHEQFMNVYNRMDIALDPHPYTGGLTTCEALWMGVPVVTLPGDTFAGRHAATHLTNADMAQFIAENEQDYIDIATKWANDIDGLAELRAGLRDRVAKTPLVDGERYAKNLEVALRHMWGEWCDMKEAANTSEEISKPKPKKSKKRK